MLKKAVIIGTTIASSCVIAYPTPYYKTTTVHVQPAPQPAKVAYKGVYKGEPVRQEPCAFYGPYVGINIGNRVNYTGAPAVYNGIQGDMLLGYSFINPYGLLGLEAFAGNSAKVKDYLSPDGISIRSSWSGGISAILGMMIADNLIAYIRGGWVRTHFRANNPDDACQCNDGANRSGWQVGLGGQSNIIDSFDIRGEYIYSQYQKISYIGTPRSHQFNIGFIYRFA